MFDLRNYTLLILTLLILATGCNQLKAEEIIHTIDLLTEKEGVVLTEKDRIEFKGEEEIVDEEPPEVEEPLEVEEPEVVEEEPEVTPSQEPEKAPSQEPEINEAEPVISEEQKAAENITGIDKETGLYIVSNPNSLQVYVNKNRRLPVGHSPSDLVEPNVTHTKPKGDERRLLRADAASALEDLFAAASEEGLDIVAVSGYRSNATQASIYQGHINRSGQDFADRYSARPGTSEHESGLAMDVSAAVVGFGLEEAFKGTDEGTWINNHAYRFGFIIRYPEGKEHITGFAFEPWHIRYVGKELAEQLYQSGLTLEEYFGYHYELN